MSLSTDHLSLPAPQAVIPAPAFCPTPDCRHNYNFIAQAPEAVHARFCSTLAETPSHYTLAWSTGLGSRFNGHQLRWRDFRETWPGYGHRDRVYQRSPQLHSP